jgi:hypothetical protein
MGIPTHQFLAMAQRLARGKNTVFKPNPAEEREVALHERIKAYCKAQWPVWMFIHARSDRQSTIAVGAPDFVIFLPGGHVVCLECKTRTGKLTAEQKAWAYQMNVLGHTVHEVRSFEQFLNIVNIQKGYAEKAWRAAQQRKEEGK